MTDNLPRILPDGTAARIERGTWPVLPVFAVMQGIGRVADAEMYRAFNMGVGMVCVIAADKTAAFEAHLDAAGEKHFRIGAIVPGQRSVSYV